MKSAGTAIILCCLFMYGCVQTIAIRAVGGIIDEYGFATLNEESDLQLAEQSIASNLKLIEILARGDPDNRNLLLTLSMGYTSYALGFVDDDSVGRARLFYRRAKEYGLRVLTGNDKFASALSGDMQSFHDAVSTFSESDVPALFWTAMSWGSYINLTLNDPDALADLPRVESLIQHVKKTDPSFYYGGAHLFLGILYGSRPPLLGGNPEISRNHFEECLKINDGKFLLTYVFYAKSYAVQIQDKRLFEELLGKVESTSLDVLPEARLPNAIAKKKARQLRLKVNELF